MRLKLTHKYRVFSEDRLNTGPPAGEYESLTSAVEHADTVTYPMVVLNWRNEVVHRNVPHLSGETNEQTTQVHPDPQDHTGQRIHAQG